MDRERLTPSFAERLAGRVADLGGPGALLVMILRGHPAMLVVLLILLGAGVGLSLSLAWQYVAPSAYVAF